MKEYILSLGNFGIVLAIAVLHAVMTVVCGIRGRQRPYSYSFKQGTILASGVSVVLLISTFVGFWIGIFSMIILAILAVHKMPSLERYIDK
ncbi:hypothetical protein LJR255_003815 [Pararhizobium sp. LjRoot255]|uniref:hypothetical protein n=1 Tax=Pararhizobium sp. LjRoot255 TaxID=3342298 RepID=UPI003ED06313